MWREVFRRGIKMVGVKCILMSISRNPYRIGVPGKEILLKNLRASSCWKRKNYCQLLRTKTFFWGGEGGSVIGKTPLNKNDFSHYCHLTDKGNYFRQRRSICLSITTRWQQTTKFSKSPPQKYSEFCSSKEKGLFQQKWTNTT